MRLACSSVDVRVCRFLERVFASKESPLHLCVSFVEAPSEENQPQRKSWIIMIERGRDGKMWCVEM